ncbi:MAG: lipid A biosynthesis acyltransferase, partial [Bacteroidota bacterium]
MQALGFYITYAFIWTFTLLPFFIYYGVSDILFLVLFYITGYRKEVVTKNLRNSFPEKGEEELKRIRRRFYRHFCDVMLESIKTMHMSNKTNARRFKFRNPELFDELYEKKKNVIRVSGHYGNWEWMVRFPLLLKHANFYLYHPLKN